MKTEKIILGIDPGTTIMGFGLIKVVGKKMEFLQLNELILTKYNDHYLKLKLIFERQSNLSIPSIPMRSLLKLLFLVKTCNLC